MRLRIIHIIFGAVALAIYRPCQSIAQQQATNSAASTNAIQVEMEAAIHQVEKIVNQPVTAYKRANGMHVGKFEGGWFHPGAIKPDFNNVDVRKTQETAAYDTHEYVTSDLNPYVGGGAIGLLVLVLAINYLRKRCIRPPLWLIPAGCTDAGSNF